MTSTAPPVADELIDLGVAAGLLHRTDDGVSVNEAWFSDPGGHLRSMLTETEQRAALLGLARRALGTASADDTDLRGIPPDESWLPIAASTDPSRGLYLVIDEGDDEVRLSLAARIASSAAGLESAVTVALPLMRTRPGAAAEFLAGSPEGAVRVGASAAAAGGLLSDPHVAMTGASLDTVIPTDGSTPSFALALKGLRIGDEIPHDVSITDPQQLGNEVVELLAGLIKAQAGSADGATRHLLAMLGVAESDDLPGLPLDDLLARGLPAIADWARSVAASETSVRAWWTELSGLLNGGAVDGTGRDADPLGFTMAAGGLTGRVLLRIGTDVAATGPVLRPAISLSLGAPTGSAVDGALAVEAEVAAITLGTGVSAIALPNLTAALHFGGGATLLVDDTMPATGAPLRIKSARAGVTLTGRRELAPLLELHDVAVGDLSHPILDLTSADAIVEAVQGALDGIVAALLDALTSVPQARALAALGGLVRPTAVAAGDPWPELVSVPKLFTAPGPQFTAYHARVLAEPGAWRALAGELATLLRSAATTAAPSGEGNAQTPWRTVLFSDATGQVSLDAWTTDDAGRRWLHLAAGLAPAPVPVGAKLLGISLHSEMIRIAFPSQPGDDFGVAVEIAPRHTATARLGDTLELSVSPSSATLLADTVHAGLRWSRSAGLQGAFGVDSPRLRVGPETTELPPVSKEFDGDLPSFDASDVPWRALELLAGSALDALGPWPASLSTFAGWTPTPVQMAVRLPHISGLTIPTTSRALPTLSLQALAVNPVGALRTWVAEVVTRADEESSPAAHAVAAWLSQVAAGTTPDLQSLPVPEGAGTTESPWAIPLSASTDLLLWVGGGGPPTVGLEGLLTALTPAELLTAAGGGAILPPQRLLELLRQAAVHVPELAALLRGRDQLADDVASLRTVLVDSDGLVTAAVADAPQGWTSGTFNPVSHLRLPAEFDVAQHIPGPTSDPARHVFLIAPLAGVAPWPGQTDAAADAKVDLTAAGLRPDAFDLSGVAATGPYYIAMPTIASAGGFDDVVARLRRALGTIRGRAGGQPLCVIAHSITGLAARALASEPGLSHVVTVGTPHAGAAFGWLDRPETADAIRALQSLRGFVGPGVLPLDDLLTTLACALDGTPDDTARPQPLPDADFAAVPAPPPAAGVVAHAWASRIGPDTIDRGLAQLTHEALLSALSQIPGQPGTRQSRTAGAAVRIRPGASAPAPGGVAVNAEVRVHLGTVAIDPDAEPDPSGAELRIGLSRPGGWLVGGPSQEHPSGRPREPRARTAELRLRTVLEFPRARAAITIREGSALGVTRRTWTIDETVIGPVGGDSFSFGPEARVLLGEIMRTVGPVPEGTTAGRLARLLAVIGIADPPGESGITMRTEPLERLLADPLGELRARLRDDPDAVLGALTAFEPGDPLRVGVIIAGGPSVHLATTGDGIPLAGGGLHLAGTLTRTAGGAIHVEAALRSSTSTLELTSDAAAFGGIRLDAAGENGDGVSLWPSPDATRLRHEVSVLLLGEIARIAMGWVDAEAPGVVGQLLDVLGLRDDPTILFRGPAAVLAALPPRPDGQPGLSVSALHQLFGAARALVTSQAGDALALPWGLTLATADAEDDPILELGWPSPAAAGGATLTGMLRLRFAPAFAVIPSANAGVQIDGLTGLDQVALDFGYDGGPTGVVRLRRGAGQSDITIPLLPHCPGFGALAALAVNAVVDALLPTALDALGRHTVIGPPLRGAGDALRLRSGGGFSAPELRELGADPSPELSSRLGANPSALLDAAAQLATTVLPAGVLTRGERPGSTTQFLQVRLSQAISVAIELAPSHPPTLTVLVTDAHPISELAVNASVNVSAAGIGALSATAEVTDPALLTLGSASALPFVGVRDGSVEFGAWTAPSGSTARQAFVARFGPGGATALLRRPASGPDETGNLSALTVEAVRVWLAPLAIDLVLDSSAVRERLAQKFGFADSSIGELLTAAELLVTSGSGFALAPGVLDADIIGGRVFALAAHITSELGATLPSPNSLEPLTIGLTSADHDGRTIYGVKLGLTRPLSLFTARGVELRLEAVAAPGLVAAGLSPGVEVLAVSLPSGPISAGDAAFRPWLKVNGVGLRALGSEGGKLIDLAASVDAVALHAVLDHNAADDSVGRAGARLLLANLGVPLGAASGGNAVAAKMLSGDSAGTSGDEAKLRPAFSPALQIVRIPPAETTIRFTGGEGDGPWWLALQRRFGPLYVDQIGLDTDELPNGDVDRVKFLVDGGVLVAGLSVQVDDLSVSVPFRTPLDLEDWQLDLAGLGVSYVGSGVTIAGGLRRRPPPPGSMASPDYAGMLVVRAAGYGLDVVGAYSELPIAGQPGETYTSMFVFAALSATLGGPPAFFVTGIGAGGGLNRRLVIPSDFNALPSFPLIAAMNPDSTFAQDPMGSLDTIASVFPPERGTFWLAAGVRFTTFVFIESIAVLSLEIGDTVEMNLLGLSRMSLPRRDLTLAQLELALRARFSSREMVVSVQAQLTDNSWLLSESCRLTGGFALVNWLRTGQFVLTVGGYHPEFDKPAEFPAVPRVRFNWAVSRSVAIKGEAYFALTASCVMAGGRLEVSYDTRSVWASLTAIINAILSWDPFFYDVTVYVRVAAGVDISIWTPFGRAHIRFSTSIGAGVHVWGPELRGEAELDLDVISVTVGFGSDGATTGKDPIGWTEFHEKYLVAGDPTGETMSAGVVAGLLTADAASGGGPGEGTLTNPWRVTPEFVMRSETRAASNVVAGYALDPITTQQLDLGPMKAVDVTSAHTLVVVAPDGFDVTAQVDITPIVGPVPEGIWTALSDDPSPGAKVRSAFVGATLAAPARIGAPEGTVKLTQVQEGPLRPLPFANEIEDRQEFATDVADADSYIAAQPTVSVAILLTAASRLAQPGSFAMRTFASDRVAPPRLAPLGEGMVDIVKPAVATAPVPAPPPAPPDPAPGPLRLHALLRAPTAKAARGALRTTVAPGFDRLARSAPPTLASARQLAAAFGPGRLELRGAPLIESPSTVLAGDGGVATTTAGGATELRSGLLASHGVANQMKAFEKALRTNAGVPLMPGDVQVWERPDAAYDVGARRPSMRVDGDQLVRIVALDRTDLPLADQLGRVQTLTLPRGTARLAVVGLGTPDRFGRDAAGAAGWHAETVLLQVGEAGYLGPGCVVTATSPATLRSRQPVTAAVVTAACAVAGASTITTRLPIDTRTVIVALETADDPDDALAGLVLGLDGGERTGTAATVVVSGTRAHGLFDVRALRRAAAMSVTVAADPRWRLAAVIGTRTDAASVGPQIVEFGLEEIIGSEQVSPTGSSTVSFQEAR